MKDVVAMRYFVSRMGRAVLYDAIQRWRFESSIDVLPISMRFYSFNFLNHDLGRLID